MDLGDRIAGLRFVIHDHDPLLTSAFREVFTAEGFRDSSTLPRTPRMNAICERVISTLRRELLDRILIRNERHLVRVLQEYLIHYNRHRPHQSRHQRPLADPRSGVPVAGPGGNNRPAPACPQQAARPHRKRPVDHPALSTHPE
ncbi:integrase core domain-containing protein [Nonomuraea sp. NPDC003707]